MIIEAYCSSHVRVLRFLGKQSDEQLRWQLDESKLCIAWHGWHLARWADYFQASLSGMRPELQQKLGEGKQVWDAENMKSAWAWNDLNLGYAETGMDMPESLASHLNFPRQEILMNYIERVFMLAEKHLQSIDETIFWSIEQKQPMTEGIYEEGTVGNAIMAHVLHINRHLGMVEALLGLQRESGTASR